MVLEVDVQPLAPGLPGSSTAISTRRFPMPRWRALATIVTGYGTPVTDPENAAVSMLAAPAQISIPSPLSMTGSPVSVLLSP
jgi:hypothetical protein